MSLKVLLIDDDPISNFVSSLTIQHVDITDEIESCTSGKEGLEIIRSAIRGESYLPDLIFLDINMPEMNGWQFLREFRKFPTSITDHIKVIILTSSCYVEDHVKARQFPEVNDYCCKPLTAEDLLKIRDFVLVQS